MSCINPFSLEGKTILVTGASSGIGKSVAISCSQMGATVILVGRNEDRLNETFQNLEGSGHSKFLCDLTDDDALRQMVAEMPVLNGIVHCAGIGFRTPAKLLTKQAVDKVMDANFKAPVLLQGSLLQKRKVDKGASIVFITSIATWSPSSGNSIYSASKGALLSYAKCLSLELAPRNIRVNCISPAMVRTNFITGIGISEEQFREDEGRYPLKRYGTPEDIAYLTIYLLSDASSWMTGSDVEISGGGRLS